MSEATSQFVLDHPTKTAHFGPLLQPSAPATSVQGYKATSAQLENGVLAPVRPAPFYFGMSRLHLITLHSDALRGMAWSIMNIDTRAAWDRRLEAGTIHFCLLDYPQSPRNHLPPLALLNPPRNWAANSRRNRPIAVQLIQAHRPHQLPSRRVAFSPTSTSSVLLGNGL